MKNGLSTLTGLAAFLGAFIVTQASAQTVLVDESFEAFAPCGTTCGNACVLNPATGWLNAVVDDTDWTVDSGGTPSTITGPSVDHTTGLATGLYLYTESSGACANDTAELYSPVFATPVGSAPVLKFWYHMFGVNQGELHVDQIDDPNNVAAITLDIAPPRIGENVNQWRQACVQMVPLSAQTQLRFRGLTGTSFRSDMAIDDVTVISRGPPDAAVTDVRAVGIACGDAIVEADISNQGGADIGSATVQLLVDGTLIVSETVATLPVCGSVTHQFAAPVALAVGTSSITAVVAATGDTNAANDAFTTRRTTKATRTVPYAQDFESGADDWTAEGTALWELGVPADGVIDGAHSGGNAWVTDLNANYPGNAFSMVESGCFDGSTMVNPRLEMWIWYEAEFSWDGMQVQTSTDGVNWVRVGDQDDDVNWYNDGSIAGLAPSGSQVGWTGRNNTGNGSNGWLRVAHDLDNGTAGAQFQVRVVFGSDNAVADEGVAFDTISIVDSPPRLEVSDASIPNLSAFSAGATNVVAQTLQLDGFGPDFSVTSITVDKLGTMPDSEIASVRLYLDDGDGLAAPGVTDPLIGTGGSFTAGSVNITLLAPVTVSQNSPELVYVVFDLASGAAAPQTFGSSVLDGTRVSTTGGTPVVVPMGPATSPLSTVFSSTDMLPFGDDFDAEFQTNRQIVVGLQPYPTATSSGAVVGAALSLNQGAATLALGIAQPTIAPNSAPYMAALAFPQGPATAAIDYSFDLSSYDVTTDDVFVELNWNNVGQTDDPEDNVFVSLDGGATWALSLYNFDFTNPVAPAWNSVVANLSGALRQEGLTFTSNMVIRIQAAGDVNSFLLIDDVWAGIPEHLRVERLAGVPIPTATIDDLGTLPAGVLFDVQYDIYNDGQRELIVDPSLALLVNAVNATVVTSSATITVAPGANANLNLQLFVPVAGPVEVDVAIPSNDPRLATGVYDVMLRGTAAFFPDIEVELADGTSVPAGATQSLGQVAAGSLMSTDYVLRNLGGAVLTLTASPSVGLANLSNVNAVVVGAPVIPIPPLGAEAFSVGFTPDAAGAFSMEIVILSDDPDEANYVVTATGTAVSPEIEIARAGTPIQNGDTDALADVVVGEDQQLSYTINNLGDARLLLSGMPRVRLGGVSNATVSVSMMPGTATVAAGASETFVIDFNVMAPGAFGFDVTVESNDLDEGSTTFSVGGDGFIPTPEIDITRDGTAVANGATEDAGASVPGTEQMWTYTITNPGSADLVLSSEVTVESLSNATASVTTQPATIIAAGASESVTVSFAAAAPGAYSFNLVLNSNDTDEGTYAITISGTGDVNAPEIAVQLPVGTDRASGSTIDLGIVAAGTAQALDIRILNEGGGPLALTGTPFVSIGALVNAAATVDDQPSSPIAAGDNSDFSVSVTPTAAGAFSAVLTIENSDGNEGNFTLTVSGIVEAGGEMPDGDDGCGCTAAESTGGDEDWLVMVAFVVLLGLRRRRR